MVLVGAASAVLCSALLFSFDADPIRPRPITSLPLLPSGAAITLETKPFLGSESIGLGGRLWPSAAALCRWLRREPGLVSGMNVLELGCGTGAVGVFAAALGAASVTLTDGGGSDGDLLCLAERNIRANAQLLDERACRVIRYEWGTDFSTAVTEAPRFDLIVASDVTYARSSHGALCASLRQLLDDGGGGSAEPPHCIIAHEHRRFLTAVSSLAAVADAGGASSADRDGTLKGGETDQGLAHFVEVALAAGLEVARLDVESQAKHGLRDVSLLSVRRAT